MKITVSGIWRLFSIAWKVSPGKTLLASALVMVGLGAEPLIAASLAGLTDAVVSADPAAAVGYGVLTASFAMAALSFNNFASVAYYEVAELAEMDFVEQLMMLSNGSPGIEHLERPEYADMLTVLEPEGRRFMEAMEALFTLFGIALAACFTAVLLGRLNPFLLFLPITALAPLYAGRWSESIMDRTRAATAEPRRIALNLLRLSTSARYAGEMRVFRLSEQLRRRHSQLWNTISWHLFRASAGGAMIRVAGHVIFGLGYIAAMILIVSEAVSGRRSIGDVVLVITLATQVNQQLAIAVGLLTELQRMGTALRRLKSARGAFHLDEWMAADGLPPDRLQRGLDLENVDFTYRGRDAEALRDISLRLPAGSVVAIIGENGAGKSTLVKLLCGLYQPTRGAILVDGVDLRRLPVEEWRRRISVGFQDFVRYELAVRDAVGVGDLPRSGNDAAIRTALERAQADDVIGQLEAGFDTQLGTSYHEGMELSGGQWQKLALGRAFMRDAPLLLVLDEPTSALDAEAEHRLFLQYGSRAREISRATGAITVLVSHRFSTVRMAEVIVVLRDGRMVESGDHASLMKVGGYYAELFKLQADAYRSAFS